MMRKASLAEPFLAELDGDLAGVFLRNGGMHRGGRERLFDDGWLGVDVEVPTVYAAFVVDLPGVQPDYAVPHGTPAGFGERVDGELFDLHVFAPMIGRGLPRGGNERIGFFAR